MKVKLTNIGIEYKRKKYKKGEIIDLEDDKKTFDYFLKNNYGTEVEEELLAEDIEEKKELLVEDVEEKKGVEELNIMAIPELKEYAKDLNLEIKSTKKAEIISEIINFLKLDNEL